MHIPSPRTQRRARIEIIPLIDIIFFLLATFMMVSLSMIKNQGLTVHLPVASSAAAQERSNTVTITVAQDGSYSWNKEPADLSTIAARFIDAKKDSPEPKIILNGDAHSQLQAIVSVLDAARKAGLSQVSIQTSVH